MPRTPKPLSTDVMTVEEAARRTGMHRDTVKKAIRAGTFPGHHPTDGVYVIPRAWFARWMAGEWMPGMTEDAA